ncbi:MAG: LamG domain-containing protein [Kiritimatiellia bacterium]
MLKNPLYSFFKSVSALQTTTLLVILVLSHASAADILMHCSFDKSLDADYAAGNKTGLSRTESYVPGKTGQAVQIDSADAELIYSAVDNLDKARGSIVLWVKCSWEEDSRTPHAFFWENGPRKAGLNSIWIWKYGSTLRFDVRDPQDRFVTTDITGWKPGEWHHIVATWDCHKGIALYIDGKCCAGGASDKSKPFIVYQWNTFPFRWFQIGGDSSGHPVDGLIDDLRIYDRPLSAEQIGRVFGDIYPVSPETDRLYYGTGSKSRIRWRLNCNVTNPAPWR